MALESYTHNKPRLDGFTLLGIPVGNSEYLRKEMSSTLRDMATMAFKILNVFPDQQTIAQSYVTSVLAKIQYRVGSDAITIYLDAVEQGTDPSLRIRIIPRPPLQPSRLPSVTDRPSLCLVVDL